jgi:hypothetical protein
MSLVINKIAFLENTSFEMLLVCNSTRPLIHSKIVIGKTSIFGFPQSIFKGLPVSYSSLCDGSCNCHVLTIGPDTPISKYYLSNVSIQYPFL